MSLCTLCPRNCKVDRANGAIGYCGQTEEIVAARAALHMWEEPCISGERGSGAVFFSGCPLKCIFCQNHSIAVGDTGKPISIERLADIFLELQEKGAHNINLVTPTHYVPQIVAALTRAKDQGLILPIVYNTASYEHVSTLKQLEGLIDIYLPDLKYISSELSMQYSMAKDYFTYASAAIAEMYRQVKDPVFDKSDLMKKGMIVRHLVLPGSLDDSKKVISYLHETYGDHIYISIMNQYTPIKEFNEYPELNHTLSVKDYDKIVNYAIDIGVENGFVQEGETCKESFIPSFDLDGI